MKYEYYIALKFISSATENLEELIHDLKDTAALIEEFKNNPKIWHDCPDAPWHQFYTNDEVTAKQFGFSECEEEEEEEA